MKNIKLHVCMTGFYLEQNMGNIKNLLHRMSTAPSNIDLEYHIIFKSNEMEDLKHKVLPPNIRKELTDAGFGDINCFSYESDFLQSGGVHRPYTPTTLTLQHEPLREFLKYGDVSDDDFVFKVRTDIHVGDHFVNMFLDEDFYRSLKTTDSPHTVFEYKIWNSLLGPGNGFEFTDYFFLSRVKELKQTLVQSHQESEYLWNHPVASCGNISFAEKLQYIKPLMPVIEKSNIRSVNSEFYWDIINNNFLISYVGEGNEPRRPVLDRNRK